MAQQQAVLPNAETRYELTAASLPIHCPMPGSTAWNSHPRVYLPVKENGGRAKCPYCGAEYLLKE